MAEKVLHEFEHGFGSFAVVQREHGTALRQTGGRKVDLYHGLDGRILLDEALRLSAENAQLRGHLDATTVAEFSCPHCGSPSAQVAESHFDIHPGATYTCCECSGRVVFEALTPKEYIGRSNEASRACAKGRLEGMAEALEFAEGSSTAHSIREHLRMLIAEAGRELADRKRPDTRKGAPDVEVDDLIADGEPGL